MTQIDENRFFTMAEIYDNMVQKLVPQYDFLQNSIFNIIPFDIEDKLVLVDLGAGSGIFIEKFLTKYPKSQAYWIDYSEDFLKVAKKRLKRFHDRVKYIISNFEENWDSKVFETPYIIFSMSAIHHLEHEKKCDLYKKCYNLLNDEGWFFNIDETKTLFADAYIQSMKLWAKYVIDQEKSISESEQKYYKEWNVHFENWKERNINQIDIPKQKGDDIHESFIDQVKFLHELGFKNADIFIKHHLWAIMGGKKEK